MVTATLEEKEKALTNLATFDSDGSWLQNAALVHIVTNMIDEEDRQVLEGVFRELDIDQDGKLSKQEIEMALNTARNPRLGWIASRVDDIFDNIDADHNGRLSLTEFLVAAADNQVILDQEHIAKAFDAFDKSHTGEITATDLKHVFQDNGGNFWACTSWNMKDKMKSADTNHDGKISKTEFESMLAHVHSSKRLNHAYKSWREKSGNDNLKVDE